MLTYSELKQNPRQFLAMTSLSVEEFDALLLHFVAEYEAAHPPTVTATGQPRRRKVGGGRRSRLATLADKLLFILVYQKTYGLQTAHGLQFTYSQSRTNELIHDWMPLLQRALQRGGYAPRREGQTLAAVTPRAWQIDGTERRRQRPQAPEKQRETYSGKKKTHTDKNVLVIDAQTERIEYMSPTVGGAQHDKKVADEAAIHYPAGSTVTQDLGFQSYAPAGVHIIQPKKRKRGGWLSIYELLANRMIAQSRILIEHVLARLKRCRIVKEVFRNTQEGFSDLVMEIACGLHNLRTHFRRTLSFAETAKNYFR
jgi:hypothetical protein